MKWPITQRFGENPKNYPKRKGHPGLDFGIPEGQPLYACCDGHVIVASYQENGYGREISFTDGKYQYIYGHCLNILTGVGREVKRGEIIGYSGGALSDPMRGMSTGPHLHFEVRDLSKLQTLPMIGAIDPETWLQRDILLQGEIIPDISEKPVTSLPSASGDNIVTVITDYINVRRDPSTKNPSIGKVTYGMDLITCGEPVNGWYPVVFWVNDGKGEYLE